MNLRRILVPEQLERGLPDPIVPDDELDEYHRQLALASFPKQIYSEEDRPQLEELLALRPTVIVRSLPMMSFVRLQVDGVWSWYEVMPVEGDLQPSQEGGAFSFWLVSQAVGQ